jgi:hypothetical protein
VDSGHELNVSFGITQLQTLMHKLASFNHSLTTLRHLLYHQLIFYTNYTNI